MATLLDWSALVQKEKCYIGESPYCTSQARSFTYIILEYILCISDDEIEDSITDGPADRGIDAVYIDERDGKNVIHLFQFKHVTTYEKSKNNFPSNEIDKMLAFCAEMLSKEPALRKTCNPILWAKVQEIWEALKNPSPTFEIHLCGNMKELVRTEKERFAAALEPYRHFNVNYHTLDSIVSLFLEKKQPKIDLDIRVVDKNYFERTDGNIRGLIATIEAAELVKLISDPSNPSRVREGIFNDNVRIYLTKKNKINRKIHATALSDKNGEFWYLNNGVTITCDSFSYQPGTRAPIVALKNVQIVNGGQTSNALYEAFIENPEKVKEVLLLARIYETKNRHITTDIAEATNSQTPINTRDLRSNDETQKKLEEAFLDQGMYYERKAHQHQGQQRNKRIDALSAGQAFLAFSLGYPEVSKKDRARVFGDLYETIFNEDITTDKLLVPLRLYAEIEFQKRSLQKCIKNNKPFDADMLFVIDGAYHVLFTVSELCSRDSIDPFDEAKAKALLPSAFKLMKKLVKGEKRRESAFTTSRFFKDTKTKSRIQRAIAKQKAV